MYLLLDENNLCAYYNLEESPGITAKGKFAKQKFDYLNDENILAQLASFRSESLVNVTFQLPQMHCASCVFLLENLHRIEPGILKSQTNFQRKEIFISYNPQLTSISKVVELLDFVGYEPLISLQTLASKTTNKKVDRMVSLKIGLSGFVFFNIMMLSFPEYFSGGHILERGLRQTFSYLILALSLPTLFWCGSTFFISAYKGIRQRLINIDLPIALAILITFTRSYYEIISGHGSGYLDSGTGIIFFMLIGRWFQDKTYKAISFDRDYKSYFPLGATLFKNGEHLSVPVNSLQPDDIITVRNEEIIPVDGILLSANANIDYSFITGEKAPVVKHEQDRLYAGGKQLGTSINIRVLHTITKSDFTQLWNNAAFKQSKHTKESFVHPWSRNFTLILFSIAIAASVVWWYKNPDNILYVLTSVLIVACPCSLLLSSTFTFGSMVRRLAKFKLYLKNSSVIETFGKVNHIVFDKTGTLTSQKHNESIYEGRELSGEELQLLRQSCSQSAHPLSKLLLQSLPKVAPIDSSIHNYIEIPGKGIEATINNRVIKIGSANFVFNSHVITEVTHSEVHLMIDNKYLGCFKFKHQYREGLEALFADLKKSGYTLHLLSGDNTSEQENLSALLGKNVCFNFNQTPEKKLDYIKALQANSQNTVLMIGDGLNDAGALQQSDIGIAITDHTSYFTPSCDAILDGSQLSHLSKIIKYCKSGKQIVASSFVLSILYNIIGEWFAVTASLSPLVAAILMPISSITIVTLSIVLSTWKAHLILKSEKL